VSVDCSLGAVDSVLENVLDGGGATGKKCSGHPSGEPSPSKTSSPIFTCMGAGQIEK